MSRSKDSRPRSSVSPRLTVLLLFIAPLAGAQNVDVRTIIEKSVQANQTDFKATPNFNNKERDKTKDGSKTYQVTMIEGTPYNRLIAINGRPLSKEQNDDELQKQAQAERRRKAESPDQRRDRIAKWQNERQRDQQMTEQLTRAFNFTLIGTQKMRGFDVWALRAKPRPGYNPPNMNAQVLPGMEGELWIDQKTYQWVKVTARVVHPVSIEGFLAKVEPGTRFELEKSPVAKGIWQPTHFSMRSRAKVLFLFNQSSNQDNTYYDYQPVNAGNAGPESSGQ